MESISRFACVSSPVFLPYVVKPRPSASSRVSIGRLRSYNHNMIKPKKSERRSKQWWRWEDFSGLDPSTEEDEDPSSEEDQDPRRVEDPMSDEELAQELEVLEKEAMEGLDGGREPSDYDRRAQIFDESSRVFKVLKEKSENTGTGNSS